MPERKDSSESLKKIEGLVEQPKRIGETIQRERKIPKEVKSWMDEVEKRPSVNVHDDNSGQTVLQTSDSSDDSYQLPIKRPKFIEGFKESVESAAKWFSVFILRVIKKKKGKVKFKQEDE